MYESRLFRWRVTLIRLLSEWSGDQRSDDGGNQRAKKWKSEQIIKYYRVGWLVSGWFFFLYISYSPFKVWDLGFCITTSKFYLVYSCTKSRSSLFSTLLILWLLSTSFLSCLKFYLLHHLMSLRSSPISSRTYFCFPYPFKLESHSSQAYVQRIVVDFVDSTLNIFMGGSVFIRRSIPWRSI